MGDVQSPRLIMFESCESPCKCAIANVKLFRYILDEDRVRQVPPTDASPIMLVFVLVISLLCAFLGVSKKKWLFICCLW